MKAKYTAEDIANASGKNFMGKPKPASINWTPELLRRFKKVYAAEEGETFMFDGHEFLKAYAKYLIEYLEGRFK